jgi:hypothetical protein
MQLNGADTSPYDTITATGNVALAGTLNVLTDAVFSSGTTGTAYAIYTPTVGDKFDLISIVPVTLQADYDGNGSVGSSDYDLWRSTFGNSVAAGSGADGNANGVIDSGDYALWRKQNGQTASTVGSISGDFDSITFSQGLPGGVGYKINKTATLYQLEFINAGSGAGLAAAVPEPGTVALIGLALPALLFGRRNRSHVRVV